MKKFLFIATLLIGFSMAMQAQTRCTLVNRNGDKKFAANVSTTDSTLTYIDNFVIKNNEGGVLEATVIGYAKDTAYSVTGKISVRFNKRRGTLTMGSVTENIPIVADAALGTSTFTFISSGGRIYLRVKGKAATNITWSSITERASVWYKNPDLPDPY